MIAVAVVVPAVATAQPIDSFDPAAQNPSLAMDTVPSDTKLTEEGASHRRRNLIDLCVQALVWTNEGRLEFEPLVGTSFGGGYRFHAGGGAMRYTVTDTLTAGITVRALSGEARIETSIPLAWQRRTGALSLDVGYTPIFGKFALAEDTLISFDVVATVGIGVVFIDEPGASTFSRRVAPSVTELQPSSSRGHLAVPIGAMIRFNVKSWFTIDLGIHDDFLPVDPEPATQNRSATHMISAAKHEIEIQAGVGFWFRRRRTATVRCAAVNCAQMKLGKRSPRGSRSAWRA